MYKILLISLLLTSCASFSEKKLTSVEFNNIKGIAVVSKMGEKLKCTYTGFTIFNNNSKTYTVNSNVDDAFSTQLAASIKKRGVSSIAVENSAISYIDKKVGSKEWVNIKISSKIKNMKNINTVLIVDGEYKYVSTGGYYARNNAFKTTLNAALYDINTGKLIGSKSSEKSILNRQFSCEYKDLESGNNVIQIMKDSVLLQESEILQSIFPSK